MRFLDYARLFACVIASVFPISCMDCNTEGCDALDQAARPVLVQQGLAGVCASLGDTEAEYLGQTCSECPYGREGIYLWKTENPVSSAQDASEVCSNAPRFYVNCEGQYEIMLDAGSFMACVSTHDSTGRLFCVAFSVLDDEITTFNTASAGYLPSLYLSNPAESPALIDEPILAECNWE